MAAGVASLSLYTPDICYILSRNPSYNNHPQPVSSFCARVSRLNYLVQEQNNV